MVEFLRFKSVFQKFEVKPNVLRQARNTVHGGHNYLQLAMRSRAKACLIDFLERTSADYGLKKAFYSFRDDKIIPL